MLCFVDGTTSRFAIAMVHGFEMRGAKCKCLGEQFLSVFPSNGKTKHNQPNLTNAIILVGEQFGKNRTAQTGSPHWPRFSVFLGWGLHNHNSGSLWVLCSEYIMTKRKCGHPQDTARNSSHIQICQKYFGFSWTLFFSRNGTHFEKKTANHKRENHWKRDWAPHLAASGIAGLNGPGLRVPPQISRKKGVAEA